MCRSSAVYRVRSFGYAQMCVARWVHALHTTFRRTRLLLPCTVCSSYCPALYAALIALHCMQLLLPCTVCSSYCPALYAALIALHCMQLLLPCTVCSVERSEGALVLNLFLQQWRSGWCLWCFKWDCGMLMASHVHFRKRFSSRWGCIHGAITSALHGHRRLGSPLLHFKGQTRISIFFFFRRNGTSTPHISQKHSFAQFIRRAEHFGPPQSTGSELESCQQFWGIRTAYTDTYKEMLSHVTDAVGLLGETDLGGSKFEFKFVSSLGFPLRENEYKWYLGIHCFTLLKRELVCSGPVQYQCFVYLCILTSLHSTHHSPCQKFN